MLLSFFVQAKGKRLIRERKKTQWFTFQFAFFSQYSLNFRYGQKQYSQGTYLQYHKLCQLTFLNEIMFIGESMTPIF